MKTIFERRFDVFKRENDSFTLSVDPWLDRGEEKKLYAFTTIDDLMAFLAAEKINFKDGRT